MNAPSPSSSQPAAPPLRLLFWETTSRCNLHCAHCRRMDVAEQAAREDLTTDEAAALIDDTARHQGQTVFVFSGGEPLLRPDLFELADRARRAGLATALATNGTRVTPELAERIARAGFSRASVSLDGASPETHDRFRGVAGAFDAALRGLRLLRDAGQAVQINTSVTRRSAAELPAVFELARRERVAALHLFVVVPVGCGVELGPEDRLSPAEYAEVLRRFHRLADRAEFETRATCAPQAGRVLAEAEGRPDEPPAGGGRPSGCLAGCAIVFVSHRGEVFPCGYLPVPCGSVRERPLSVIWRDSEVLGRLRRRVELLEGVCGACPWRNSCGGCRARAFAATGRLLATDPGCPYAVEARTGGENSG